MVKMINKVYGVTMWVADYRVEEYKAAGHKLAAASPKEPTEPKPKAKKKATKK